MKKIPFLAFTAIIIIAASTCILLDFHKEIMASTIVGFILGLAPVVSIAPDKKAKVGEMIKIGAAIGIILFVLAYITICDAKDMSDAHKLGIAVFAFIGSSLGSIVGCMYKGK